MSLRQALVLAPLLVGGVGPAQGYAQEQEASAQLWGNVVLDFPKGERFLLELDVQPKVQYAGADSWRNLDVTSVVEYYPNRWLDLVGEASFGRTQQSNDVSSVLFFTLNREDFSFVIHFDRQPRTSRRREAQAGSRARSGSRSERTLDAVEHSRTLMEWWPFLIFHRGGLRIKVINNTRSR